MNICSNSGEKALQYGVDDNDVGWLEWNETEHSVNVLSSKVLKELENLLPHLENNSPKALILVSKNPKSFIAGVNVEELKNISSKEEFSQYLGKAHRIFSRLKALKATKIAAIHGACLGGGLELVLLCDYRLASDSPETRLGLPEVKLGLIPGLGGCFRLPKRVGLRIGLEMILSGKIISAKHALDVGLVDKVFPPSLLEKQAATLAHQVIKGERAQYPSQKFNPAGWEEILIESFLVRPFIFFKARKTLLQKTKGFYPAPFRAWEVIKKTYLELSLPEALMQEKKGFLDVALTSESRNLMRLFFLRSQAKKQSRCFMEIKPLFNQRLKSQKGFNSLFLTGEIKREFVRMSEDRKVNRQGKERGCFSYRIGVLGAGVMGGSIARFLADKGYGVRLRDVKEEVLIQNFKETREFWKKQVIQGKINPWEKQRKEDCLSFIRDFSGFSKMDLIIEALPEDRDLKKKNLAEIGNHLTPDQVLASSTSSLRIGDLASSYPWPERFVGVHFFNPVYKMPLVEIVKTKQSDDFTVGKAFQLVKQLGKIPVIVKDSPGFIVNRLLMPYLSEALWFLTEGHPIKKVDYCYTHKFGFPMGPFRLMDEVGLDLCLKVIQSFESAGLPVPLPEGVKTILQDLCPGRKQGEGFYIYGKRALKVSEKARRFQKSGIKIDSTECIHRGLYRMMNEAVTIREEGVAKEENIDLAMVLGAGFPPFLGGPLEYARGRGFAIVKKRLQDFSHRLGPRFTPHPALK